MEQPENTLLSFIADPSVDYGGAFGEDMLDIITSSDDDNRDDLDDVSARHDTDDDGVDDDVSILADMDNYQDSPYDDVDSLIDTVAHDDVAPPRPSRATVRRALPVDDTSNDDVDRLSTFIRLSSPSDKQPDDEELMQSVIADQYYENRLSTTYSAPPGVVMIDKAPEDVDKYTVANDTKALSKIAVVVVSTLAVVIVLTIIIGSWIMLKPQEKIEGNLARGVATSHPYVAGDQQEKQSQYSDKQVVTGSQVSQEMSSITYKVSVDGNINSASTSYIENDGKESTDSFVAFPWEKSVSLSSNIVPQLGVATSGNGTVTCTIEQDGKEIAQKKSDGQDPIIIC